MSGSLPLDTRFSLGPVLTAEQRAFLDTHGFLHFERVASLEEVAALSAELDAIEARWIEENRREVFGVPVFWGRTPEGAPRVQRFTFSSLFSSTIRAFVHDARFEAVRTLVGEDARVGDRVKDGVVVNRYAYGAGSILPRLGWHTDGLRDLFYGRLPAPMLNVGLHFDTVGPSDGGLRLIPGTHRQGFLAMCFRKPYFVGHRPDPHEITITTQPGDLTVHDGRLWHRVARPTNPSAQRRRTMYVPYLTGPYEPKDERSRTPGYHRLGRLARRLKGAPLAPRPAR